MKSFADDLNTERGIVSSRVALLLRSAEIKPLFFRFVFNISSRPGCTIVVVAKAEKRPAAWGVLWVCFRRRKSEGQAMHGLWVCFRRRKIKT